MFYIRDAQGNEDGPHSVEVLIQRLAEGSLTLFSIARREDQSRWRSLGSFTEFARARTGFSVSPNTPATPVFQPPPKASVPSPPTQAAPPPPAIPAPGTPAPRPMPAPVLTPQPNRRTTSPVQPPQPAASGSPRLRPSSPSPKSGGDKAQPPPLPVFDPMSRLAQQKAADVEETKPSVFLPKWVWRVWGVLLFLRFCLWLASDDNTRLGFGKLLSLPFVTFVLPLMAAGWAFKKSAEDHDKAALAFIAAYLFLWVLAW